MSAPSKHEMRFTETNSADDSSGKTWGLEGNLFWYLVDGAFTRSAARFAKCLGVVLNLSPHSMQETDEPLLFAPQAISSLPPAGRARDAVEKERPWLEPVWRDDQGSYYRCRYELVYRWFAITKIHEIKFTFAGQQEADSWPGCDFDSGPYFQNRLEEFICDGWPTPTRAGAMEIYDERSYPPICKVIIFGDDLFLCPKCADFKGGSGRHVQMPCIRDNGLIDYAELHALIERHRRTPEFQLREGGSKWCAEKRQRVLEKMKLAEDTKARRVAYQADLARATSSRFPLPGFRTKPSSPLFVYAVQGGDHVKIGLAKDVKTRVLALQTSCPFELKVLNAWEHSNAPRMERLLHKRFEAFRTSGEWFRLPFAELELLRSANRLDDLL